jgi:hypothetical protein
MNTIVARANSIAVVTETVKLLRLPAVRALVVKTNSKEMSEELKQFDELT